MASLFLMFSLLFLAAFFALLIAQQVALSSSGDRGSLYGSEIAQREEQRWEPDVTGDWKEAERKTVASNWVANEVSIGCEEAGYTVNPPEAWCPPQPSQDMLLIMVATAPHHFTQRERIRRTWGSVHSYGNLSIILRFFIGATSLNAEVKRESEQYHDVVQQTFYDSYANLTLKTLGALSWVRDYCQAAKYVLKTDDDTFLSIFNMARFLLKNPPTDKFICGGGMRRSIIIRDVRSKWYVSEEALPGHLFPPYCHGFGYFVPATKIPEMLAKSCVVPKITVEDAFCGILASHLNISHVFPPTEPKKLSAPVTEPSLFPWALWVPKTGGQGGIAADFHRYKPALMFVAHMSSNALWNKLWQFVEDAEKTRGAEMAAMTTVSPAATTTVSPAATTVSPAAASVRAVAGKPAPVKFASVATTKKPRAKRPVAAHPERES